KPRKLSFKEQRELEEINKSLPILEAKKEELTNLLSDPNLGYDKITTIGDELQKIVDELEEKEFRWLELSE
ncbi:MAG: ABC transporter C-terminal domain-containing protein, partial [Empedobacter falsenii]